MTLRVRQAVHHVRAGGSGHYMHVLVSDIGAMASYDATKTNHALTPREACRILSDAIDDGEDGIRYLEVDIVGEAAACSDIRGHQLQPTQQASGLLRLFVCGSCAQRFWRLDAAA